MPVAEIEMTRFSFPIDQIQLLALPCMVWNKSTGRVHSLGACTDCLLYNKISVICAIANKQAPSFIWQRVSGFSL